MPDLVQRSVQIILENQSPSGAYVASPNFPTYRYCWFRDGAYIAYAMNRMGQHSSAARFHSWAANIINRRAEIVACALKKVACGESLSEDDILHTRYTLNGEEGEKEAWPNFQLDGFGTWLWSLAEYKTLTGASIPDDWISAARLVSDYLAALWHLPCYDCWEEFPNSVHTSTLAAIYGGLQASTKLTGHDYTKTTQNINIYIHRNMLLEGHFVKARGRSEVDASLISLAVPYQVIRPDDPGMLNTIRAIEQDLLHGGLQRYRNDTYYGGGEWILLSAWLGWYYARSGQSGKVQTLLKWVESQADDDGNLPEQVPEYLNDPAAFQLWQQRWGEVASPLLWSHAKFLIFKNELESNSIRGSHP
jgi:GH15 family glucan-1,4-alpha-glucosidase